MLHQISGKIEHVRLCVVQIRLPTLALKPRGDNVRSRKQGYQRPHKKDENTKYIFKKNQKKYLSTETVVIIRGLSFIPPIPRGVKPSHIQS